MWSHLYYDSCLSAWGWLAQATPVAPASPLPAMSPAAVPLSVPMQSGSMFSSFAHKFLLFVYCAICLSLICCVLFQTTKSEGLSGVIGGTSSSSLFRGKRSSDETLSLWTSRLAVAFIACSLLIWVIFSKTSG